MKKISSLSIALLLAVALSANAAPPVIPTSAQTYNWSSADGETCVAIVKAGSHADVTFRLNDLEFVIHRVNFRGEPKKGPSLRKAAKQFFKACVLQQPELLQIEEKDWRVRSARLGATRYAYDRHHNLEPEG